MNQNERNSRKRLNSLILLVAFTAVMLIVSTYAWFSTQKNVTIKALEGTVNVAEGLQISLDAKTWKNEIDFSTFGADGKSAEYLPDGGTLTNPLPAAVGGTTITNIIPIEMLPVSSTGTTYASDNKQLAMYSGENEDGNKLENIELVAETGAENPGYYAIDLYLQNSSAGNARDTLQLQTYSNLTVKQGGNSATGIQNTVRVALAQFNDLDIAVDGTKGQADILQSAAGKAIKDVAIWEPNADAHVDYIKANQRLAYAETSKEVGESPNVTTVYTPTWKLHNSLDAVNGWADQHYTWALNSTAAADKDTDTDGVQGNNIDDVYVWVTRNSGLTETKTLQTTTAMASTDDPKDFVSANDGATLITLAPSQYVKLRMYIWLEGQDVDCINYASLGGGIKVEFGFSKPGQKS